MVAGAMPGGETVYKCSCGAVLLITDVPWGLVRGVYCRDCRTRRTVHLGGEGAKPPVPVALPAQGGGMQIVGNLDPRNPPIEAGPVRPVGGRG